MGNQFTTVDTEPEYIVQAYLDEAMKLLSDEGDVSGALEALEDAKENSINMHVISAIEGKIKTLRQKAALQIPAEKVEKRKKKSSEDDTRRFNEQFLALESHLSKTEFDAANKVLKTLMDKTDFETIKSVGTYFLKLMDNHLCKVEQFRMYDTEQDYCLKENILVLLRNLAFASFQRNMKYGIKIDIVRETNVIIPAIEEHEKHYKC